MAAEAIYTEVFSGPVSRRARYRLFVSADLNSREMDALIQQMQLYRGFLAEDEAEAATAERALSATESTPVS
jgi:hypothetical protein